ncbi:MAG: HIT family protein [Chloroflexota bacterium]
MPGPYSHQPEGYACPFCVVAAGGDVDGTWTKQTDVVYRDELVTVFVNASWWPANPGSLVVVSNAHHESVYEIPDEILAAVQIVGKRMALALKATYQCGGTSLRQHNEPAGNQDVWHYHLHVFPRYANDGLYGSRKRNTTPQERQPFAEKLRAHLEQSARLR